MNPKNSIVTSTLIFLSNALFAQDNERPNFIFYMAEDVSKHNFRLYNSDGKGAETPFLENMAKEGVVFENAFCNSPVSSAARTTLITGRYTPSLGLSWHRRFEAVKLPEGEYLFPALLRRSGYYTLNGSKTDYNSIYDNEAWVKIRSKVGGWRDREGDIIPFFACYTNDKCHASSLNFPASDIDNIPTRYNPDDVKLAPQYIDNTTFRYTQARYYDILNEVDSDFGKMLEMLESDGELDNTFIFYMGDNGGSMPISKGHTTEMGLNVPLVVYIPEKWRDKVPFETGSRSDCFVNFIDLAPTLLNLAGVRIPEYFDGEPIMGDNVSKEDLKDKNISFGYGDRYDELYASTRTVRVGNMKYSRNLFPYHSKSLYCFARYRHQTMFDLSKAYYKGELNDIQSSYFKPQGAEELYDLEKDPYETNNLANDSRYREQLESMRDIVINNMLKMNDLAFVPESVWALERIVPSVYGKVNSQSFKLYSDIINLQLFSYAEVEDKLRIYLKSKDWIARYWSLVVCCGFGKQAKDLAIEFESLQRDPSALVASKYGVLVASTEIGDPIGITKQSLSRVANGAETWQILNDAAYIKSRGIDMKITLNEINKYTGIVLPLINRLNYLNDEYKELLGY